MYQKNKHQGGLELLVKETLKELNISFESFRTFRGPDLVGLTVDFDESANVRLLDGFKSNKGNPIRGKLVADGVEIFKKKLTRKQMAKIDRKVGVYPIDWISLSTWKRLQRCVKGTYGKPFSRNTLNKLACFCNYRSFYDFKRNNNLL